MITKSKRIAELLVIISNKSGRIKKLKIECGQQATQICVLTLRIKELENALQEIIVESGNINRSEWPAQQQKCFAIADKALKGGK